MKACDPLSNPILASCRCDFFGLDIAAVAGITSAVVGVVGTGISLIGASSAASAQASAAAASAAQAQQIAEYNATIQEQNALVAYQLSVAQAQQTTQLAEYNIQIAALQEQTNLAIAESNRQLSMVQASVSAQNADIARQNADLSRLQADAAQKEYDQELANAAQQEQEAEAIRAQQREEARRLREESEQRIAAIRSKYGASGVTFEGSPLIVLADAARLAETSVQDAAYIAELEARKKYREAEITRFEAEFSLIDKAGFMSQAAAYEAGAFSSTVDIFGSLTAARTSELEAYNISVQSAMDQANFETQMAAAQYDTIIAGAKQSIALNEADLTRFEGAASSYNILAQSAADTAAANADMFGTAATGLSSAITSVGTISKSLKQPVPITPGFTR